MNFEKEITFKVLLEQDSVCVYCGTLIDVAFLDWLRSY